MTIIYDHLLMFADEAAARTALDGLGYSGFDLESGPWWHQGCVMANVPVTLPTGVEGERTPIAAFFVVVSLPEKSTALMNLPNAACRVIGNQETGEIEWISPEVSTEVALNTRIEVVPCGSGYVFE